jgi:hypothetical protein
MATLAAFIALGGTSYAITKLPRNSVGTAQLQRNAVTADKIRKGAVGISELARDARSLGTRGPRGAEGPPGPAGATGPAGPTGPSNVIQVRRPETIPIPAEGNGSASLATITVEPGAWMFEAQTQIFYEPPSAGSEWFDCFLGTAAGETLAVSTMRVGTDAQGVITGVIPLQRAVNLSTATQVTLACSHPSSIPGLPSAHQSTLLSTKIGSLEDR